jgi:XTP/dITP diphosphohydrolase
MQLWIATGNNGKMNEFKLLFNALNLEIHSQRDLPVFAAPVENGKTYEENARIKARAVKSVQNKVWVMGEDSGLECEGLGNLPGIHSARYAGAHASDIENVAKLLKMLQLRSTHRQAVFRATIVVYSPEGQEFVFSGQMSGQIAKAQKGQHGFGYDPIFVPNGETQTLAELGGAYKAKHSHRTQAVRQMIEQLGSQLNPIP